jgi:hypothetical protein
LAKNIVIIYSLSFFSGTTGHQTSFTFSLLNIQAKPLNTSASSPSGLRLVAEQLEPALGFKF